MTLFNYLEKKEQKPYSIIRFALIMISSLVANAFKFSYVNTMLLVISVNFAILILTYLHFKYEKKQGRNPMRLTEIMLIALAVGLIFFALWSII